MIRKPTRVAATLLALLLYLPCVAESIGPTRVEPQPDEAPEPLGTDYRIGLQDLIEIRVFELEELSQTVRVGGDGFITLPLLGKIRVAGRTKSEIEQKIAEGLHGRFVLDPQVTVFIKEFESTRVAVSGAVQSPGRYEMLGPMTLLEMISQAGGLREDHGREVVVMRAAVDGATERIEVDLRRLVREDPSQDLQLEAGDVVYVQAEEHVRIFVSGAVNNPNMFEVPDSQPVTMMQAITLAGGTTPRAAEKKIQIIRTDASGQRDTVYVNYRKVLRGREADPILQPGDVVFVQESFF